MTDPGHVHGSENPYAGQGPVILDIGGDVGALIVTMPTTLVGAEVEIRPEGAHVEGSHGSGHCGEQHLAHVAVVARRVGEELVPSLVYPALVEGSYELYLRPAGAVELIVAVAGGQVTYGAWPDQPRDLDVVRD